MKHKCCDNHISRNSAKELLTEHGLSKTKTKTEILLCLSNASRPLSASEIHDHIGFDSCNKSTVFRTLGQFKEKGLINEINLGEDFYRYEIVNLENNDHHHHHVRCRDCGDIQYLEKCDLSSFEKMIAKLGFKKTEHYLEFTGICSSCS
jgi:Fur family ferric uptake transcriptional regulator